MEGKDVEMTVCNLLANLSKWKREDEGRGRRSDFVLWLVVLGKEELTAHVNSGLLESGSLREGPPWAQRHRRLKKPGDSSLQWNLFAPVSHMLRLFLGF